jgi:hypothetical protein
MKRLAALALCLVLGPWAAAADPPGRVARLAFVEGEASLFADTEVGWEPARVNAHLTSENSVWTEPASRAEVRFGSTALRLGEATQLDIVRLDDDAFRAHLPRGTLSMRIREIDAREVYAITTPEARFQLRSAGRYRVDVDPARGESRLAVLSGNARLEVAGGYVTVDTGRALRVTGGERTRFEFETAYASALDDWALARDQRFESREAARYVPPQMTGWEDLDDYGTWRSEAEYGPVWYPTRVETGWAPYRYGRWTWVRPWGWAWVDDAPWGYAPFHYGRWVHVGNRWGWCPGRYTARPVWAPALVGWIGGPGWSVTLSTGPANVVGWYPLSPYDRYQPWYPANVTYVTNINHIVLPPRHDRHRDGRDGRGDGRDDRRGGDRHDNRERGATVMPREHFGSRRPVQAAVAPVGGEVVRAQPVVSGSSVLPGQAEWRMRTKPAEAAPAPRPSAGGQAVAPFRPSPPAVSPAPAEAPASRPMAVPSAKPAAPATPQALTARSPRPAPQEQPATGRAAAEPAATPRPSQPVPRVKPAEPVAVDRGAEPAAIPPRSAPAGRAVAPEPRVARPVPSVPAQPAAAPPAVSRPAPAAEKPAARGAPAEKPGPAKERPARGQESPAPSGDKPSARGQDKGSGG